MVFNNFCVQLWRLGQLFDVTIIASLSSNQCSAFRSLLSDTLFIYKLEHVTKCISNQLQLTVLATSMGFHQIFRKWCGTHVLYDISHLACIKWNIFLFFFSGGSAHKLGQNWSLVEIWNRKSNRCLVRNLTWGKINLLKNCLQWFCILKTALVDQTHPNSYRG